MTHIFETTNLWQSTLASRGKEDADNVARDRLRNTFISFRGRVALLAAEIHRNLPDYTVHDITHLDALWEMADIIAGQGYALTPTEAFVLGGSILLHDLGMGLASYPRGVTDLQKEETWADVITAQFQFGYERQPTEDEIANPPEEIKSQAIAILLRNLHARHAEQLAFTHWEPKPGEPSQYLIEDIEIRQIFGRAIGLIAHSHWWAVNKLEDMFPRALGAPPWCPNDWIVDPLKLACLLRVADASHIDARRAPTFLRAIRKPGKYSDEHWSFQEKLQKPYLSEDALTYTSGYAFPLKEADSWWLCLDTLSMIDRELRQVDALLADKRLQRFAARRVAAVDSPERLITFIPTDKWLPIDAHLKISDVPNLIKTLGGEELYGRNKFVPLRELIQNAADAIRARRYVEGRDNKWGVITVRLGKDDRGDWLEVEDNGIGMSAEVLTRYLLDFGNSYWGSNLMLEEFPGLLASGIKQTGKYGIGFFSVFMLGETVQIRTRRADAAQNETLVLEFNTGLSSHPLLRPAVKQEWIRDGGTSVRIWMKKPFDSKTTDNFFFDFLHPSLAGDDIAFDVLCQRLCPALDVNLHVEFEGSAKQVIIASDWLTLEASELFARASDLEEESEQKYKERLTRLQTNLRTLINENGEIVGRACIANISGGVITIGGLYSCNLNRIVGVLVGRSERAARDFAMPLVSFETLSTWASEQARLIADVTDDPKEQYRYAQTIKELGGSTGDLPIAFFQGKWIPYKSISEDRNLPDRILIIFDTNFREYSFSRMNEELLITSTDLNLDFIRYNFFVMQRQHWPIIPDNSLYEKYPILRTLFGEVIKALAERWEVSIESLLFQLDYEKISHGNLRESKSYISISTEGFKDLLAYHSESIDGISITKPG